MKRFLPLLAVLILCFSLTAPASAVLVELGGSEYDLVIPDGWDAEQYPYAIAYYQNQVFTVVCSENKPYIVHYTTNGRACWRVKIDDGPYIAQQFYPYKLEWMDTWASGNDSWDCADSDYAPLIMTNFTLSDADGVIYSTPDTSFFPIPPKPLMEVVQGVTTETLEMVTVPALARTVSTVVLCGVGCLALLMFLVLFGKRSQIFHI